MPNTPTVPVVSIADDGTVTQYPSMNAAAEAGTHTVTSPITRL